MDSDLCERIFIYFCQTVVKELGEAQIANDNKALAAVASYFWPRLDDAYRTMWKDIAKIDNDLSKVTGKHKSKGFWMFALSLRCAVMFQNCSLFHEIWQNLSAETRKKQFDVLNNYVQKEIVKMQNTL